MDHTHRIIQQLSLSDPQKAAATARGVDITVTAGAGTGKTRTLVARFLSLAAGGMPLRRIVAITFTRKAAREMRNRVRAEISGYLEQEGLPEAERRLWGEQLVALDAARISTIHNLCGEILRAHPAEAGIDPRVEILDETRGAMMLSEAVESSLAWAADQPALIPLFTTFGSTKGLRSALDTLMAHRLEAEAYFQELPDDAGEILSAWEAALAGRQEAALNELMASAPWQAAVAALRENQAANPNDTQELNRLTALGAAADGSRDHPLASRLRDLHKLADIDLRGGSARSWPDGAEQMKLVKEGLKGLRELWKGQQAMLAPLNPQDDAAARALPLLYALFARADGEYRRLKEGRGGLDFDDLEDQAIRLLTEHAGVRARWQAEIGALLIDEFQDTNARQLRLARLLCPEPSKLFIVGDAKQSIYRFRGADVAVFRQERAAIEAAGGDCYQLDTSYRAHRQLLEALNQLMAPVLGDPEAAIPDYVAPFSRLEHHHEQPAAGIEPPFVELHLALGPKGDGSLARAAAMTAARIRELAAGSAIDYEDVAILCRASNAFAPYEDALDAAGIPYQTVSGKGFFQRPEIRELLNGLKAIADPSDDSALAGLLRSSGIGLSDVGLYQLAAARPKGMSLWGTLNRGVDRFAADDQAAARRALAIIGRLSQQAGRASIAAVLKRYLDESLMMAALRQAGMIRAARNVSKLLADAHNSGLVTVGEFLEYVANLRDSGSRAGEARATAEGAVQIMTVHAAKGLEFPVVVIGDAGYRSTAARDQPLIDPDLGLLLPLKQDDTVPACYQLAKQLAARQEAAESSRLLYVAATRAEQKLLFSGHIGYNQNNGRLQAATGWLGEILAQTEFQGGMLGDYDPEGSRLHQLTVQAGAVPISISVYEPARELTAGQGQLPRQPAATPLPPPLLGPLPWTGSAVQRERMPIRRVIPAAARATAPAWMVGTLVHESLAAWRFPGGGFEPWIEARARGFGLAERSQLDDAVRRVSRLLARFQRHPLYREIIAAERRLHELPYDLVQEGQPARRVIDLLYLKEGRWHLVDFKTDWIQDKSGIGAVLHEEDYEAQVGAYAAAVERLVGQRPECVLCFLNVGGGVYLHRMELS